MEKDLEAQVGRMVKQRGGLWLKWTSPGYTGVPDRIVLGRGGRIAFVEMKQEGGRLSARQSYVGKLLQSFGFKWFVVYNMDNARAMLREVFGDEVHTA